MTDWKLAIRLAVKEAIEAIGIDKIKAGPFFGIKDNENK